MTLQLSAAGVPPGERRGAQSCPHLRLCSCPVLSPTALLILCPCLIVGCGPLSRSAVEHPPSALPCVQPQMLQQMAPMRSSGSGKGAVGLGGGLAQQPLPTRLINERWRWTPRADVKPGGCGDLQIKAGDGHRPQGTRSHGESRLRRRLWLLGFYMPS